VEAIGLARRLARQLFIYFFMSALILTNALAWCSRFDPVGDIDNPHLLFVLRGIKFPFLRAANMLFITIGYTRNFTSMEYLP